MGYIYKITNLIDNMRYIGYTTNTIPYRFNQHLKYAKEWQQGKRKYTKLAYALTHFNPYKDFKIEEIEECDNSIIKEREIYWINYFGTYPDEYNMTRGGDGGKTIDTQHHRELFKNPVLQYDLDGNFIAEYITSGEAAEKTGIGQTEINRCTHKGRNTYSAGGFIWKRKNDNTPIETWIEANKTKFGQKPVLQYDLKGNFIQEFSSAFAAGKAVGSKASSSTIGEVCKGKQKTAYGYIWKYKENDNFPKKIEVDLPKTSNKKKAVLQYDGAGNLIREYSSIAEAKKITGFGTIGDACRGTQKQAHGYIWKFKDDIQKEEQPVE